MTIGNKSFEAIIDTGASASFVADEPNLLKTSNHSAKPTSASLRLANNSPVTINSKISLKFGFSQLPTRTYQSEFLVLPGHKSILGYKIIIGLNIINTHNIDITRSGKTMTASIKGTTIGKQKSSPHGYIASVTFKDDITKAKDELDKLVTKYCHIFADSATSCIKTSPLRIELDRDSTPKATLGHYSIEDETEITNQIQKLLKNGVIQKGKDNCPFAARAHLVPKKNGTKRMVINYIPLNRIAIKDSYPIPRLQDMFNKLHNQKYFAAFDCTEGFLQINIHPADRYKTTFIVPNGNYHYTKMPFGFTNSPAKFQKTMDKILAEGLLTKCLVYIDDILVFAKNPSDLVDNISWLFNKCDENRVLLKKDKCIFFAEELEFLGYKISLNSISPIQGKCEPVRDKIPKTKKELSSIISTFGYYSRFIDKFSEKTKPLRELAKQPKIVWLEDHKTIVHNLLNELATATSLTIPDSHSPKTLKIYIGHSSIETACFDDKDNLVGRCGNLLSVSQKNYTCVEKTLLGIINGYKKFYPILRGDVTIQTPYREVRNVLDLKDMPERVTRLLLQLPPEADFTIKLISSEKAIELAKLSEDPPDEIFYTDGACCGNGTTNCKASWAVLATINSDLSISALVDHVKPSNQVAELVAIIQACKIALKNNLKTITIVTDSKYASDSMNKWIETWESNGWMDNKNKPLTNQLLLKELAKMKTLLTIKVLHVKGHSQDPNNEKVDLMAKSVLENAIPLLFTSVRQLSLDQSNDPEIQNIRSQLLADPSANKYEIFNDEVYYPDPSLPLENRYRKLVPSSQRQNCIRYMHDDPVYGGHLGRKKTMDKLKHLYWPNMQRDINDHIEKCLICQKFKTPRQKKFGLLQKIPSSRLFERLHIDVIGTVHETRKGNKYIITAIDAFSRFAYAIAQPEVKVENILNFLTHEVISKHGVPESITSDNGPQFTSLKFKEFTQKLDIKHVRTSEYHPEANGMDERFNGSLVKILRNYIDSDQSVWDDKLPWALFIYNVTINESTQLSPYTILYGREPRLPLAPKPHSEEDSENYLVDPNTRELIMENARINSDKAHDKQKFYHDKERRDANFKPMELVLIKSHSIPRGDSKKLCPKWEGPFLITKIIQFGENGQVGATLFDIKKRTIKRRPIQDLKKFYEISDSEIYDELPGEIITNTLNQLLKTDPSETNQQNNFLSSTPNYVGGSAPHRLPNALSPINQPKLTNLGNSPGTNPDSEITITAFSPTSNRELETIPHNGISDPPSPSHLLNPPESYNLDQPVVPENADLDSANSGTNNPATLAKTSASGSTDPLVDKQSSPVIPENPDNDSANSDITSPVFSPWVATDENNNVSPEEKGTAANHTLDPDLKSALETSFEKIPEERYSIYLKEIDKYIDSLKDQAEQPCQEQESPPNQPESAKSIENDSSQHKDPPESDNPPPTLNILFAKTLEQQDEEFYLPPKKRRTTRHSSRSEPPAKTPLS